MREVDGMVKQRQATMSRRKSQTLLGVISDVHGDVASLRDALAQLARLDVSEVVCAGDLLDWGPSPNRVIELLLEQRITCVRGNHDFVDAGGELYDVPSFLNQKAVAFVNSLLRSWRRTISGVRVAMWHASPGDMMQGIYGDRADAGAILRVAAADVLIVAHTHVPMELRAPNGSIVNPGSVLRDPPRTEPIPSSGTFGVLELPSRRFSVHRSADGAKVEHQL
jgi:putative phosphoesterase